MTLTDEVRVVDADTHLTEQHDLFTSRAPKGFEDRVPRVVQVDGKPRWVVDADVDLGPARAGGVIDRDGNKYPHEECFLEPIEWAHRAAWDPEARLAYMDDNGFTAQVLYPNAVGVGGHVIANQVKDPTLRRLSVEIYNDAMAELQEWSGNRLLPMPCMPAWSVEDCVREAQRVAGLGLRGVNMTSDTQNCGAPDLADPAWDPFWEVCADLGLPVHFHIAGSLTSLNFYGQYFWPSQHPNFRAAIGGAMLYMGNARVLINTVYAGIFERHPKLQMVSVESGMGWVPFLLTAMDYQIWESAPKQAEQLSRRPSEYVRDHWFLTFWFEYAEPHLQELIDRIGEDRVLFETDFPHPTCFYPHPLETAAEHFSALRPETRRKILSDNGVRLYRL